MCWLDDVYHFPCGHWGVPVVSARCPAGYIRGFFSLGCTATKKEGMQTSAELCTACKWRHRAPGRIEALDDDATDVGSVESSVEAVVKDVIEAAVDVVVKAAVETASVTSNPPPGEIIPRVLPLVDAETNVSLDEVEVLAQIMAKMEEERARVKRDATLREYGVEACQIRGTGTWLVRMGPPLMSSSGPASSSQTESQSPPEYPELNELETAMLDVIIRGTLF